MKRIRIRNRKIIGRRAEQHGRGHALPRQRVGKIRRTGEIIGNTAEQYAHYSARIFAASATNMNLPQWSQ